MKPLLLLGVVLISIQACTPTKHAPSTVTQPAAERPSPPVAQTAAADGIAASATPAAEVATPTTTAEAANDDVVPGFKVVDPAALEAQIRNTTIPPVPSNDPVAAEGVTALRDVVVTESVPTYVGMSADLIDRAEDKLIVLQAFVERASWNVSGFGKRPSYPADGVVSVRLTDNQWEAVKAATRLAVQPHKAP